MEASPTFDWVIWAVGALILLLGGYVTILKIVAHHRTKWDAERDLKRDVDAYFVKTDKQQEQIDATHKLTAQLAESLQDAQDQRKRMLPIEIAKAHHIDVLTHELREVVDNDSRGRIDISQADYMSAYKKAF